MHPSSTARRRTGGGAGPPSQANCVERLDIVAIRLPSDRRPEAGSGVGEGGGSCVAARAPLSAKLQQGPVRGRVPYTMAQSRPDPISSGPAQGRSASDRRGPPSTAEPPLAWCPEIRYNAPDFGASGLAPGGSCNSKGSWPVCRGPLCRRCGGADCSLPVGVGPGQRGRRIPFEPLAKCRGFVISSTG